MTSQSLPRFVGATLLLLALGLGGCAGASTVKGPIRVPLTILGASVQVDPTSYSGPCGGTQSLTLTATLTANPGNAGGTVHYVWIIDWTIDHARSESDVTFAPGVVRQTVTHALAYSVPVDAGPELRAAITTTTPNALSSPDVVVAIACTVGFQIVDVSVTMQPWSTDCGPHTFGWSALLTAPLNHTGGQVSYTWGFAVGPSQDGTVTFAPGQVNATVAVARSYTVVPSSPSGSGASSTPGATTPTASLWPEITAAQIAARLDVDAPNRIADSAALDHSSC
jgi:hypothetical protein